MQRHYRKYTEALKTGTRAAEPLGGRQLTSADDGGSSQRHYTISEKSRGHLKLSQWALGENAKDPALKVRVSTNFHVCCTPHALLIY